MLVLGIETSTPQTSVALGSETGVVAASLLATGPASHELVVSEVARALDRAGMPRSALTAVSVGLGPGLFTGMRVGVAAAKAMAQGLGVPIVGFASLDLIAFSVRYCRRLICVAVDGKRKELFFAFYRPAPGGVTRTTEFEAAPPARLAAELVARPEDILLVGNGTLVYRRELEEAGSHVEVGAATYAYPSAGALVELAVPRFQREQFDRVYDLTPLYIRKSDAEIAWDRRRTG